MFGKLKIFAINVGIFYNKTVKRVLDGTHNHFLAFLPEKSGLLSSGLLNFIFSKISILDDNTEQIRKLSEKGTIVYANKYKSRLEYLFANKQFGKNNLPAPELSFGHKEVLLQPAFRLFKIFLSQTNYFIRHFSFASPYKNQYFKDELTKGHPAFFSLFGRRSFYARLLKSQTNPAQELIKIQGAMEQPIFIVPQAMFYSKRPLKSSPGLLDFLFGGLAEKPGKLRRIFLLLYTPGKIFVELGDPVNLKEFLAHPDRVEVSNINQALALRRLLLSRINLLRQRVTGPLIKSREEIKESIMAGQRLQKFIEEEASQSNKAIPELNKEAYGFLDEIASNYSLNWVMAYDVVLTWMLKNLFDGMVVEQAKLDKLKKISEKTPLIFMPTHKSHLDYLILSYLLYYNNMACPHVAAGQNLSFWPLGTIFRGGGAFFMRRTFKGQKLYSRVFLEYVYKILQEGFNIEFFLEGSRSRTGKMLSPKTGLLSIIIDAYHSGACNDLTFVPVNIGYDRIIEEAAYIHEVEGGEKKAENLPDLIKARKSLKKRYGKVYVEFGEPITIKQYLAQTKTDLSKIEPEQRRQVINRLGDIISSRINTITTITPYAIVSSAILNCQQKRFTYDHLMSIMETYLTFLSSQGAKLADTLTSDDTHSFGHALDSFAHRKFIEHFQIDKDQQNPLYMVNENKRPAMEYYKNNCICFFVPASFSALAILELDSLEFTGPDLYKQFEFLRHLFSKEFLLNSEKTTPELIRKSLKGFIDNGMLGPHGSRPDTYQLTLEGIKKLKLFSAFLISYLESYQVVLSFFKQNQEATDDHKDILKKILTHGRKMYKNSEIDRLESVSKLTFKNAQQFFTAQEVTSTEDKTKADFYTDKIERYRTLIG